ncbi:hypothetical protein ACQZ61_06755 [Agrobacterium vitis]|uniref:hypothetical protein n=1 Tax=Agrobacterium vitis TaxID=373 RepID=UPI0015DAA387|nr:hypothetical protein [Agrobacterium vitis]MCF1454143.1 hypothetical protein [Agrobacterium vitis]BCH55212.1 hypothetical protein RvVAR031_28220 [Agrobacterium vitis]
MIEYALLFALGFTAAALLAALISPAIHGRIVAYTERRLRATAPLGPEEVRAQKDMVRAVYAAETAKLSHDLRREREYFVAVKAAADQAQAEAIRALGAEDALKEQIHAMSNEAGTLRVELRQNQGQMEQLKATLQRHEAMVASRDLDIEALTAKLARLEADLAARNRETATHKHQTEDLQLRLQDLRTERETLRDEAKAAASRAQKAEQRLLQEEDKVLRLEERLERLQKTETPVQQVAK